MQKSISLKIQASVVIFGMLLFSLIGVHVSSKEHVNKNGVRVAPAVLDQFLKPECAKVFRNQLGTHRPLYFSQFPNDCFNNLKLKSSSLSVIKKSNGEVHLKGLTYDQMSEFGLDLPLFIIQ